MDLNKYSYVKKNGTRIKIDSSIETPSDIKTYGGISTNIVIKNKYGVTMSYSFNDMNNKIKVNLS